MFFFFFDQLSSFLLQIALQRGLAKLPGRIEVQPHMGYPTSQCLSYRFSSFLLQIALQSEVAELLGRVEVQP